MTSLFHPGWAGAGVLLVLVAVAYTLGAGVLRAVPAAAFRRLTFLAPLAALGVAAWSGLVPVSALGLGRRGIMLIPFGIALGVAEAGAVIYLSGLLADGVAAVRLLAGRDRNPPARWARPIARFRAAGWFRTTAPPGPRPRRAAIVDASLEVRPPARAAAAGPIGQANWLAFTRGRWARHRDPVWTLPLAVALALMVGNDLTEEGLLRGCGIAVLRPAGGFVAVLLVAAVSALAVYADPVARRDRCNAGTSAALLGLVHGALMWVVPTVVPLVAARTAFYLFALP